MGKVDLFTILLEKQQAIYMAGEIVRGQLIIRINERLKINSVRMLLTGAARVHWTESHGTGKNRHTVHYTAYEEYLNFDVVFVTKQDNNDCYLEVGELKYPFQVQLPPTLPTSFEHYNGRVRYSLNGTIDIPWAFDKHVNRSITVISPVDLNLNPALRQPASVTETKTLCCWCCKSDPIIATLSLFKGGYVPGEGIPFNASVDNKSSSDIKNITFKLIQSITLYSTRKCRTFSRVVAEICFDREIQERSYQEWRDSVLTVPPVCASSNNTCKIINVSYYCLLNVNPEGLSFSFDLVIPVVIGTIPLMPVDGQQSAKIPQQVFEASAPENDRNDELEDKRQGEITNMDTGFAPFYPYYKDFSILPR